MRQNKGNSVLGARFVRQNKGNLIDFWLYLDGSGALGARLGSKENENLCGSVVFFLPLGWPMEAKKIKVSAVL